MKPSDDSFLTESKIAEFQSKELPIGDGKASEVISTASKIPTQFKQSFNGCFNGILAL